MLSSAEPVRKWNSESRQIQWFMGTLVLDILKKARHLLSCPGFAIRSLAEYNDYCTPDFCPAA